MDLQKLEAAKIRIAEAEKASAKKLRAARKEKKDRLKEKEGLLRRIAQYDAAFARKERKLREKDAVIENVTNKLVKLNKEKDKIASEIDMLDDAVTTTEVILLLKHVIYKLTPKGVNPNKTDAAEDNGRNGTEPLAHTGSNKKGNQPVRGTGKEQMPGLPTSDPKKMKILAEKVLATMKEEIEECDGMTNHEEPDEELFGRHGSFYFPSFPEKWPDSSILGREEIKTEVIERIASRVISF